MDYGTEIYLRLPNYTYMLTKTDGASKFYVYFSTTCSDENYTMSF